MRLDDDLAYELDVPGGWGAADGVYLYNPDREAPILFAFQAGVTTVPADPCGNRAPRLVGPTRDDLVEAVRGLPGLQVSEPVELELGGYPAVSFDVRTPPGSACDEELVFVSSGTDAFVWDVGDGAYRGRWWVVDALGSRVVFGAHCAADSCEAASTVYDMVESVSFQSE